MATKPQAKTTSQRLKVYRKKYFTLRSLRIHLAALKLLPGLAASFRFTQASYPLPKVPIDRSGSVLVTAGGSAHRCHDPTRAELVVTIAPDISGMPIAQISIGWHTDELTVNPGSDALAEIMIREDFFSPARGAGGSPARFHCVFKFHA